MASDKRLSIYLLNRLQLQKVVFIVQVNRFRLIYYLLRRLRVSHVLGKLSLGGRVLDIGLCLEDTDFWLGSF